MYKKNQHIHFIGIGGIGMSGIAELLLNLQYRVSGSDLKKSASTKRLASLGATVYYGHSSENIAGAHVVVVSSAVSPENPEVAAAQECGIPVIPRAEMLAELMRLKYSIAVAGAHGKTTTTSLIAAVLDHGGIDPTVVIGGKLITTDTNAVMGSGEFLVAEADESDGSFVNLPPTIAVVTNIDREHTDYYASVDDIKESFLSFLNKVPFYGLDIICLDDHNLQSLIPRIQKRVMTYGRVSQADLQARDIRMEGMETTFNAFFHEHSLGTVRLRLPGIHNVYNSLAAIAVGLELDLPFENIQRALVEFKGIQRRFQMRMRAGGITWIDDYAHHPTEIQMTLRAVKALSPRRVVALFQPHRYTRVRDLFHEFLTSFYDADLLIMTDIYPAGEGPLAGVSARGLYEGMKKHGHKDVHYFPKLAGARKYLIDILAKGDVLLTLGAGDVWQAGDEIMRAVQSGASSLKRKRTRR